jgi:class 3 adenylate cyclase
MQGLESVQRPTGVVTLLFSDIEGSTRLLRELGDGYVEVLGEHHRLLREAWSAHRGVEMGTEGDAFFVVFADPGDAARAALSAQRVLDSHLWPEGRQVRVRMGVHTESSRM